ncbi:MAG TPA: hypothetical protein VFQ61_29020 [Polyangiaceae bacterium]|nr:hypothetical protein [Polyangiaceae bacterium]
MSETCQVRGARFACLAALSVSALLLGAKPAQAQQFGDPKTFTVGVERLAGFVHSVSTVDTNPDTTVTSNTFTLLPFAGNALTVYSSPRLAFDYFVIQSLSIGGSLGFGTFSRKQKVPVGVSTVETETVDTTGFLLSPRIGYGVMFSKHVGIWPRLGITYAKFASAQDVEISALALSADVPLVIVPTRNIDIMIGLTGDLGLDGSLKSRQGNTSVSLDTKTNELGVQAGFGVYF